jgi:predicted dehydrogenase
MRFGLIGCGTVGEARAQALRKTPGATLTIVADAVTERAEVLARQHGCTVVPSVVELAHHSQVDAVIVATPPHLHVEHGLAALMAGKHMLVEKPLASSVAGAKDLVDAARARRLTLATGFNYRYYPAVRQARALIDRGGIGQLDHIRSFAGHPGGHEFTHPWVHDIHVMGGGTLMDNGIHIVDLTRYFLGDVADVVGYRTNRVWEFEGCEDNGFALLRNADGNVATLHATWTEWRGYRFRVEIYGMEGCVIVNYPPMLTQWFRRRKAGPGPARRFYLFPLFQLKERLLSPRYTLVQSFVLELTDFMRRVGGATVPAANGVDGLRAVQIADAVYRSASQSGEVVRLEPLA